MCQGVMQTKEGPGLAVQEGVSGCSMGWKSANLGFSGVERPSQERPRGPAAGGCEPFPTHRERRH